LINCAIFALAANPDPAEEAMALQMKPSAQWRSGTGQASHCGRVCVCVCVCALLRSCTLALYLPGGGMKETHDTRWISAGHLPAISEA